MVDRNINGAAVSLISIFIFVLLVSQLRRVSSGYDRRSYYDSKMTDETWLMVQPKRY